MCLLRDWAMALLLMTLDGFIEGNNDEFDEYHDSWYWIVFILRKREIKCLLRLQRLKEQCKMKS